MGSRSCRTEMLPPITTIANAPTTPYSHLRQCSDRRPPHPHQFAISCPIYLCVYEPIYIRCIAFSWHFYIPEHYRFSLMRDLRDVDLHRPGWNKEVESVKGRVEWSRGIEIVETLATIKPTDPLRLSKQTESRNRKWSDSSGSSMTRTLVWRWEYKNSKWRKYDKHPEFPGMPMNKMGFVHDACSFWKFYRFTVHHSSSVTFFPWHSPFFIL